MSDEMNTLPSQEREKTILERQYDDTLAFIDSLPVKNRAQAFAVMLIKNARQTLGEEEAKPFEGIFKSKEFLQRISVILEAHGTKGLIDEMRELDPDQPSMMYEFLTGEKWVEPGNEDIYDTDDYLHVDID